LSVYRPRTRLVNFRLSVEEYQVLKETCARSGARSVSDYARAAVLTGAASPTACPQACDRLEGIVQLLEARMNVLVEKEPADLHA
jgi:hypothetical protein